MKESYVNQTGTNVTSGLLLVLKTVFMQTTQQTNKKNFPQKASQACGYWQNRQWSYRWNASLEQPLRCLDTTVPLCVQRSIVD